MTKSPEQQLEDIKANLEQAAIDAYLNQSTLLHRQLTCLQSLATPPNTTDLMVLGWCNQVVAGVPRWGWVQSLG